MDAIKPEELATTIGLNGGDSARLWLVDFDQTLYGSNSTEDFLASARPAIIVLPLIVLFRKVIPRVLGERRVSRRTLDFFLLLSISVLAPWVHLFWRRHARELAQAKLNHPLAKAIAELPAEQVRIVSFGFEQVIRPLLDGSSWSKCQVVSRSLVNLKDAHSNSKVELLKMKASDILVSDCAVVTDSLDDADLLESCQSPHLITPTGDKPTPQDYLYLPLRYTFGIKFSLRHALDQVVFVDLVIALIACPWLYSGDVMGLVAYISLFAAIFTVYEIGYHENDVIAIRYETRPRVTAAAKRFSATHMEASAWLWVVAMATLYVVLRPADGRSDAEAFVDVGILLVLLRGTYYAYNRVPEQIRVFIYPLLQIGKSVGILLLTSATIAGMVLSLAQACMMITKYVAYRIEANMSQFNKEAIRLQYFLLIGLGVAAIYREGYSSEQLVAGVAAVSWVLWRALKGDAKRYVFKLLGR